MIKITRNKEIPQELKKFLANEDAMTIITSSPMMAFITLSNISKIEKKAFLGDLKIGYTCVHTIPFLVFEFSNIMSFDVTIENLEAKSKDENALNLLLIESTTHQVLETRVIGLDNQIIQKLIEDTEDLQLENEKVYRIRNRFSTKDLMNMCSLKQAFNKTNLQ